MTPVLELADKYFKIAVINILKVLSISSQAFKELRNHSYPCNKKKAEQTEN